MGGFLLGIGVIATSRMTVQWHMYVFHGLIAALGMSTAYIPCNTTVVKWFQRKRGLALGLASSGSSCGILAFPPLASCLIAQWGWRPVYCAFGVTILLLLDVVARFMVRSPELLGLAPDGDPPGAPTVAASPGGNSLPSSALTGWTLQEARALPSSARNRFLARITRIAPRGAAFKVHLDCGFPLVAFVTRPSI